MSTTVRAPDTIQTEHGELSRDPAQYRPTNHFRYRYRYREAPSITDDVVETCLREGTICPTNEANRFRFEAGVAGIQWRLVVQAIAEGPPHLVITAYSPQYHDRDREPEAPV